MVGTECLNLPARPSVSLRAGLRSTGGQGHLWAGNRSQRGAGASRLLGVLSTLPFQLRPLRKGAHARGNYSFKDAINEH